MTRDSNLPRAPSPRVIVYSEVSADGKTSHRRGASSKPMMVFEDAQIRRFRHELRAKCDAIMVGSNTIRSDDPHLTVRGVPGPNPLRVVPASRAALPLHSHILSDGGRTLVAVSASAPDAEVAALVARGAEVVHVGETQVDLTRLLSVLHERGVRSLMVEGGARLLSSLFRASLVDELVVQHLPVVFGGEDTPAMVGGPPLNDVSDSVRLTLVDVKRIGEHAVITYQCREE